MSKERIINTRFWNDSFISNLDPIEKLLFIYFLTNEHTNISGIYELPLKIAAVETGIDPSMLNKVIPRLSPKINSIEGWICIPNFTKHQHLGNPSVKLGIERELMAIPQRILEKATGCGYPVDRVSLTKLNLTQTKEEAGNSAFAEKSSLEENAEDPETPASEFAVFEPWMKSRGYQWVNGPEMPDGTFPDVWGDQHGVRLPQNALKALLSDHKRLYPPPPRSTPVLAQYTRYVIEKITASMKDQFGSSPMLGKADQQIISNLIKRTSFDFVKRYGFWFFNNEKIDKKYKYGVKPFASNTFINQYIAETGDTA